MSGLPFNPGRWRHSLNVRLAFLEQDRLALLRYPLTVRFGPDEHDRNMLTSACSFVIDEHAKGRPVNPDRLALLESDVVAFLSGGAALRLANKRAREDAGRLRFDPRNDGRAARNLADAYRPEGVP